MFFTYLTIFVSSLLLALLITPIAKTIALRMNCLDIPGPRKIHQKPIPLFGGEIILLSLAPLLFFQNIQRELITIMLFGLFFVVFGFFDDAGIKIRARYKIWGHLLIAFGFVYLSGIKLDFFSNQWINIALSACFITFMTNSMNMLDGMDGLVAGISALCAFFFGILSINYGQIELFYLTLALMGATLGFLKYNFSPASIFLGETGSTFLGYILAIIAIKLNIYSLWNIALAIGIERLRFISFIIPLVILGIPIFDTYFVFANRFFHRIKFSQPGTDHSHHRIHLMGFSQKATVLTLYTIQIILGFIALAMVGSGIQQFFALLAIVAIFFIGFTGFLTQVKVY